MTKKSAQYAKRNDKPQLDAAQRTQALVKRVRWIILAAGGLALMQVILATINGPDWPGLTTGGRILLIAALVAMMAVIFAALYFLLVLIVRRFFSRFLQ